MPSREIDINYRSSGGIAKPLTVLVTFGPEGFYINAGMRNHVKKHVFFVPQAAQGSKYTFISKAIGIAEGGLMALLTLLSNARHKLLN